MALALHRLEQTGLVTMPMSAPDWEELYQEFVHLDSERVVYVSFIMICTFGCIEPIRMCIAFSQIFNTYFSDQFLNAAKSNMYQCTLITQLNDSLYVLANIRQSAFIYDLAVNTNCALAFFSCPITFMAIQKDLYK